LFDLEFRFFAPTRNIAKPTRAGAVKVGRRPNLAAYSALARPYLDSFEHDGTLSAAPDEIIGLHFSKFYTEEDQAAGIPDEALATARREGKYETEGWRVRKDGTQFCASVVIDAIRNDKGELLGFAKVTRDITERMQTQRALRETQEQLPASQKMDAIGQLTGGIAHDFNNLLMVVIGNLETIQRGANEVNNPNLLRATRNAMRGAQRAASLTHRLLAFSRRQALSPKPLDIQIFGGVSRVP
jgi:signal transduction histidine kinase